MKRDYKLYLEDIKESVRLIEEYTLKVSKEQFKDNLQLQDAIIRRILIIGEASRNIPLSLKDINQNIPWKEMENFRDFIVHSYFHLSIERIWKIAKIDVPIIKESLKRIKLV